MWRKVAMEILLVLFVLLVEHGVSEAFRRGSGHARRAGADLAQAGEEANCG